MKPSHLISALCFALLTIGCKEEREFPKVKKLSDYKQTDFILTPESKLPEGKNSVYCATMLLAWDGIRGLAENDLTVAPKYSDLTLLNNSKAFENTLKEGEYTAYTEYRVEEGKITTGAEFKKSLSFAVKLSSYNNRLKFKGEKVKAFGVTGMDDYELLKNAQILYFKNEDDFIVKLKPKDSEHEILLYMTKEKPVSMGKMFSMMESKAARGRKQSANDKSHWKYHFDTEDELIIPKFRFNIENDYENLMGNNFLIKEQSFVIERAWQRTAFILDEEGAQIESEAYMESSTEEIPEEDKPRPQKLIFNKPFLVVLKRVDNPNPYFAMWVDNSELMIKE